MFPDPARVASTLEAYRVDLERRLFSWNVDGQPVCAAGLSVDGRTATLLHLDTPIQSSPGRAMCGRGYRRSRLI